MAERHADSNGGRTLRRSALAVLAAGATGAVVLAAELQEQTVAAWERYLAATEQRVATELEDGDRFLAIDFHEDGARFRREALAGRVVIEGMQTRDERGERIRIPKGSVQHLVGLVLVPNAELNDVLDGLQYDVPPHELQEDVLDSRVISRDGDTFELYVRVDLNAPMASAQFNIEQQVEYVRPGGDRAWSRIRATRIAEVEDPGSPDEREKPIGNDSGYLWRLSLFWRYQQVDGGVLVESEQLSLSRGIPALARVFLSPIINGAPRDALEKTLRSVAEHFGSPPPTAGG
jgi:hypothetical protein